jgi:hypothetical protein
VSPDPITTDEVAMSRHRKRTRKLALGPVAPLEDRTTPAAAFALSNNALIPFDTDNPAAALAPVPITLTGVTAGETLVGIDVRPQNGMLYGLTSNGAGAVRLYTISPRSGVATPLTPGVVEFDDGTNPVPIVGTNFGIAFNPTVDRLRVVTDGGFNFRMNPNTGALIDGDNGGAATPGVNPDGPINMFVTGADAAAYTNNAPNVAVTTLYTLSAQSHALYIQTPPNSGTQTAPLLITLNGSTLMFSGANGFDIPTGVNAASNNAPVTGRAFAALTVSGATHLYGIELSTGVATDLGPIGGGTAPVQGFAVFNDFGGLPAVGLDATGKNLVRFNTGTPGTTSAPVAVSGVGATEVLVGIDYRPATGQLVGLGVDAAADKGTLYIIDPQTGAATAVGTPGGVAYVQPDGVTPVDLPPASAGYGFDVNPAADRVRVTTGTGLNFRIDPSSGAPVDGDPTKAGTQTDAAINGLPAGSTGVTGTAYTNSFAQTGTGVTTQYTLDAASKMLFIQTPPNTGTQTAGVPVTLGGSPLAFTAANGFDIPPGVRVTASGAAAAGTGYALLTVGANTDLYALDLTTGAAAKLGTPPASLAGATGLAVGDAPAGTVTLAATSPVSEAGGSISVTLSRAGGTTGAISVTLGATGGTAASGTDFTGLPQTITIPDGKASATATIPLIDNHIADGNKTLDLGLSAPTNLAVLGTPSTATVTITDSGGAPPPGGARSVVVSGQTDGTAQVFAVDKTGQLAAVGSPLSPFGGAAVNTRGAVGDVNGDGTPDFILVTGPGTPARFAVVSGKDGTTVLVPPTDPFGSNFTGGAFVAAGDFDGDGRAEMVITPDMGGGPNVVIFSLQADGTLAPARAFFALGNPTFRGGARVAVGDINGDKTPDLAVGAGFLGGPVVEIHNGTAIAKGDFTTLIGSGFFAFPGTDSTTLRNGVFLAIGDLNGDGFGDLIAGGGPGGGPRVLTLSGKFLATGDVNGAYGAPVTNFFAGPDTARGGIRVAAADVDGDGRADLLTASGDAQPAQILVYLGKNITSTTPPVDQDLTVFGGATLANGVYVG